jgi:hypothetical protein
MELSALMSRGAPVGLGELGLGELLGPGESVGPVALGVGEFAGLGELVAPGEIVGAGEIVGLGELASAGEIVGAGEFVGAGELVEPGELAGRGEGSGPVERRVGVGEAGVAGGDAGLSDDGRAREVLRSAAPAPREGLAGQRVPAVDAAEAGTSYL